MFAVIYRTTPKGAWQMWTVLYRTRDLAQFAIDSKRIPQNHEAAIVFFDMPF